MKTLFLECNMGAAGDMLMASLLQLHSDPDDFLDRLNKVGIPGVSIVANQVKTCGISGLQISVLINGKEEENEISLSHTASRLQKTDDSCHVHHHHDTAQGMHAIEHLIGDINVPQIVKNHACSVYKLIADAESFVHGTAIDHIHFHEVGTMDAIADIVGVCMLIEELAPEQILSTPIHVGSGHVCCAHGTPFGSVRVKVSSGFGVTKNKAEYDDLATIARNYDMSYKEATDLLLEYENKGSCIR